MSILENITDQCLKTVEPILKATSLESIKLVRTNISLADTHSYTLFIWDVADPLIKIIFGNHVYS